MSTVKNTFNTLDALSIAIKIFKDQGYAKSINVVGEEKRRPNKEILLEKLTKAENLKSNLPESKQDIQELLDIKKDLLFKKLSGNISDYEAQVLDVLNAEKVHTGQIGILSSIPLMLENIKKKEKRQEQYDFFKEHSTYQGQVGSQYFGAVTLHQKKYHERGFWIYTFVNDGKNILKWLTGKDYSEFKHGANLKVSGIVKAHNDTNFYGKETLLTKCKLTLNLEGK
tara:strand:+ start:670 stop:1347 length:678 start_codon:yes stop_codon:yes gene_type:complete